MENIKFISQGITCAAWHIPATSNKLANSSGRPCIVMAHGFGGTRDTGLIEFAKPFSEAGIDTFVFDYRGFGDSGGFPRQDVSYLRQREDYHAAISAARSLPDVDETRVAIWGTSYSGGHVVVVAAQDKKIAAVISMTPATDGLAALSQIRRYAGIGQLVAAVGHGLRDLGRVITRREPYLIPIVGQPGSTAIISTPGAEAGYKAMAGPTWRNEVCARTSLEIARNRPITFASKITCPLLVQVGSKDQVAPPDAARKTASLANGQTELLEYPIDHFDVYGGSWQEKLLNDQLVFLKKVLSPNKKK
ncbi:alpha/beta hydrolase [Acinetobacter baylyi]|uniref:Serine aminopeptidase S33 domain-containing protein n=1 Tax=Acinetobacter baylyi (strain ATCC 33305 / BD413 / ADP1) TaxID=62977 RepID=Q6F8T1_ACIAD|nr:MULTISPECIES: alpha/beta hydrolase [Acinetobacter]ENV53454.1 hypothetical protein F952_02515 [Acinetobacter baylyi DSM 14961 = CIP 107474]KAF2370801.1 alpha/beta hydrolase [Acinetobacter baylyi]CAG69534.1 conserved hypothetical protein; putative hydrolase of the alpha/beta superfamily [Acinetobacter baylyi ADP1]KAF2375062.1 alpha/beta hydrolase [Acinetobacter baylyi]KAF2378407.1 alpha/beta hydrolase [Acinetobacter baylyi]